MLDRIYLEITNICNLNCTFCHKTKREKKLMSKYLSPKKRHSNRKLWILLAAVLVAVVLVIFAVVKLFDSTLPDKPNQPDNSSLNGEQNQGQNQGSNSGENNQGNSGSQGENNQQDPPAPPAPTDDSEKIAQAEKLAKGYFDRRTAALKKQAQSASVALRNVFLFCEEVFGDGQELLILVTELTVNHYASAFISRYGCEEYIKHNKQLLFYERQKEIVGELELLDLDDEAEQ